MKVVAVHACMHGHVGGCAVTHSGLEGWVSLCWVLPCLWQQAVVPVDVVWVEAELALLDVLLDWGAWLVLWGTAASQGTSQTAVRAVRSQT